MVAGFYVEEKQLYKNSGDPLVLTYSFVFSQRYGDQQTYYPTSSLHI